MFGSFLTETDRDFRAVNITCAAIRFDMRYTVATIEVIFKELRVFGGDVSGYFAIQKNGKSGLPFVFAAIKDDFGFLLVKGRVLPV